MENKKEQKPPHGVHALTPLDIKSLKEAGEFTLVFADGKSLKCQLIAVDRYNVLIKSEDGRKLLVQKHAVKYYIL